MNSLQNVYHVVVHANVTDSGESVMKPSTLSMGSQHKYLNNSNVFRPVRNPVIISGDGQHCLVLRHSLQVGRTDNALPLATMEENRCRGPY